MNENDARTKTARQLCQELAHLGIYWNENLECARGLSLNPEELWEALVSERMVRLKAMEILELIVSWLESPEPSLPPETEAKIEEFMMEAAKWETVT
jgi:hypothetical protein